VKAVDLAVPDTLPTAIGVHGARQNNLRDVDVNVPLWRIVAVVGVSGSGKTPLAIGTLYGEGLQRFLEGLSTYSRRRLTQAQRPDVDRVDHLPPRWHCGRAHRYRDRGARWAPCPRCSTCCA
jgi:excinuclease ABC subunit A